MENTYNHLNLPGGTIRLAITNLCNMNCFYCHNEGQDKENYHHLAFQEFVKIMEISKKHGMTGVSFTGGEPFLNKDLSKMIEWAIDNGLEKIDICSNGILIPQNIGFLKSSKAISVVIGIDTCKPEAISKQSDRGVKFEQIEKNIQLLKENVIDVSINTVYTIKNKKDVFEIIEYCRKNGIDQRIIEEDTYLEIAKGKVSPLFSEFIKEIAEKYGLKLSYAQPGKGYFAHFDNGCKVCFYHSKCHSRDCLNCARWSMRIDSWGRAIPCYIRNQRIPLLGVTDEESKENFLRAIYNLGIAPEEAGSESQIPEVVLG